LKGYQNKEELAKEWSPSVGKTSLFTLKKEIFNMSPWKLEKTEVPLIIRITENPDYDIGLFPGAVSLYAHDCIHILLGRGVLPKDEAFVIGFTMGSTGKVTPSKERIFCTIAKHLYPEGYKFTDEELSVYKMGLCLARNMGCKDLSRTNFKKYTNYRIPTIRKRLGIDLKTLRYYYYLEKQMFPDSPESQRLI